MSEPVTSLKSYWNLGDITVTREELLASIRPGDRCQCGQPAVVKYVGGQRSAWSFCWPRCGDCPGAWKHHGVLLAAMPMEGLHRSLLRMLGIEQAWLAALRLGYRPPAIPDPLYPNAALPEAGCTNIDPASWE